MRKLNSKRLGHHIRNLLGMITSVFIAFFIVYKVFNLQINFYSMILNIISCFLGIGIYLSIIFIIYSKGGHFADNFKIVFDAIDKISDGDFSVFIDSSKYKHNRHNHIMNVLAQKVNDMAKQLSTMEMMRQDFVSNVSHEIQSPLTSIQGFAILLKNDNLSKEDKKAYLEIIDTETKRLSKLSNNLLKLSALDSGAKELQIKTYDLANQFRNVILFLEPQWSKKNIEFEIECQKTNVNADEELMSEVWINLLSNGIKFTPDDGKMYVSVKRESKNIQVTIRDSGIGIKEEEQKRIFERFYMADKSRKRELGGNGLGLSIVKKIIDLHGGSIRVESETNRGAAFIVSLLAEI
ncbi:sensor histidine kinase [Clostridium saccharobutylicum]|uniref:sensor histidine kinase n=1 Tax=Clostridium saccharobutylicum TaxID=169679 RepID=UPI00156F9A96|nr:HAMP domain-containing sensor histidine kinase [Clostridium saccharobutylicum]NSB90986.1 signal transduction histidine kinase [Clostridium saccharobutylicum]NYC30901.1 signal transduction histidine kinase [Clostridium saccharobutylicum]